VEFPEVQQTRADLLGAMLVDDRDHLVGVELQSANDPNLPLRMPEYALRTYRKYGAFPSQYILYVGNDKMRMPAKLVGLNFSWRYRIIDIRTLDEESFAEQSV
jgi:hypothetical protein